MRARMTQLILASLVFVISCMPRRAVPPPSIEIWLSPPGVGQGRTVVVWVRPSQPLEEITGRLADADLVLYPFPVGQDTAFRALIGIAMDMTPGEYELEIEATDRRGRSIADQRMLRVEETEFVKENISVPSGKTKLLTSEHLPKEAKAIRGAMRESKESQSWEGIFIPPAEGRISSPFGARRVYNGGTASWRHRGVDIANREGTAIVAPGSGKVVLSEAMTVHGETVILDHGQGVFSIFNHFVKRFVEVGDEVRKGQTIGLMGQTGLATGPHLHWGLYVEGVPVAPFEWAERLMDRVPWQEVVPTGM